MWQNNKAQLVDEEEYLVRMKHGLISGFWSQKYGVFRGYYFADMEWHGIEWIAIADAKRLLNGA